MVVFSFQISLQPAKILIVSSAGDTMARRVASDDEPDDEPEDEGWSDDDLEYVPDEGDDDPTMPCPHCQEPVFDEAERCPHCGKYISTEDAPPSRKPWWIIIGALLCLFAVYLWIRS